MTKMKTKGYKAYRTTDSRKSKVLSMPLKKFTLIYRQFDFHGDEPFSTLSPSMPIRYHPTPNICFDGLVVSKTKKKTIYDIPELQSYVPYRRVDIEIIFVILLRVLENDQVPARVFATDWLYLIPAIDLQGKYKTVLRVDDINYEYLQVFYPSLKDVMKDLSSSDIRLWVEGWKWWYYSQKKWKDSWVFKGRIARDCN